MNLVESFNSEVPMGYDWRSKLIKINFNSLQTDIQTDHPNKAPCTTSPSNTSIFFLSLSFSHKQLSPVYKVGNPRFR